MLFTAWQYIIVIIIIILTFGKKSHNKCYQ